MDAQVDLSFRRAHLSTGTFSHVVAHSVSGRRRFGVDYADAQVVWVFDVHTWLEDTFSRGTAHISV